MKKPAAWLFLALLTSTSAWSQYYFDYPTYKRFSIGLTGGQALPRLRATSYYRDTWNDRLLISVAEASTVELRAKAGLHFGVQCAWFFNPSLGIRLEAGYLSSDVSTSTEVAFAWTWADGRHYESTPVWNGAGRMTTLPIGLNGIWKGAVGRHEWFLTGGLSYYRHTFRADSSFGYGISMMSADGSTQYIDALRVGLRVPEISWSSLGFNIGLGGSLKLSDLLGFQVEAGYFLSPSKTVNWTFVTGNYNGVFFSDLKDISFGEGDIEFLTASVPPKLETGMRLKPSFFRFSAGFVLFLGRAEY